MKLHGEKNKILTQIQTPHIKTPLVRIIIWIEKICQNTWVLVEAALEFVDEMVTVFLCLFFTILDFLIFIYISETT